MPSPARATTVRAQPRAMLSGIPGLELIEPGEQEICCGSAGVYNLLQAPCGPQAVRTFPGEGESQRA